jgi:hypothetical protein
LEDASQRTSFRWRNIQIDDTMNLPHALSLQLSGKRQFFSTIRKLALLVVLGCCGVLPPSVAQTPVQTGATGVVRVDTTPGHILNQFDPDQALGSSIDVLSRNGIDKVYSPHILQESLSAGWGPITYRNNTELAWRPGTGIPWARGAMPPITVAISPAARN